MSNLKILVSGTVNGKFGQLYARVNKIIAAKGKFDMLLCVGPFMGDGEEMVKYCDGTLDVPIPTYFTGHAKMNDAEKKLVTDLPASGMVAPNIFFLGSSGMLELNDLAISAYDGTGSEFNMVRECSKTKVDILLTSDPPPCAVVGLDAVTGGDDKRPAAIQALIDASESLQMGPIDRVAQVSAPSFHFTSFPVAYDRPQFANKGNLPTRLLYLAPVGTIGQKWLHASFITPRKTFSQANIQEACKGHSLTNPYSLVMAREAKVKPALPPAQHGFASARYGDAKRPAGAEPQDAAAAKPGYAQQQKKRGRKGNDDRCWFCLESKTVEQHLVVTVGNEVYIALAKGGITPDHCLIVPLSHQAGCYRDYSPAVRTEVDSYIAALEKMYEANGQTCVVFERKVMGKKHIHSIMQVSPIPKAKLDNSVECFQDFGDRMEMPFFDMRPEADMQTSLPPNNYFLAYFPGDKTRIYQRISNNNHPLELGREVVAAVMGEPHRANWRACTVGVDAAQETKHCEALQKRFALYDPNL